MIFDEKYFSCYILLAEQTSSSECLYQPAITCSKLTTETLEQGMKCFFSIWGFIHNYSRIIGLQGKGDGISSTPHYHFHPLHRHLDISRAITAEISPLHIGSSQIRNGSQWRRSGVFIVTFENISHLVVAFLWLTLSW